MPSRGPGDEADGTPGDAELIGQEAEERLVGGTLDRRRRDPGPEDTVNDALDVV